MALTATCCEGMAPSPFPMVADQCFLGFGMPIFVIAQKEAVIPGVERGPQKQAHDPEVAHLAETAVRGHNASAHDSEPSPPHLLTKHVVFREQRAVVKAAELIKAGTLKQHKHARAERFVKSRKVLHQVVAPVK